MTRDELKRLKGRTIEDVEYRETTSHPHFGVVLDATLILDDGDRVTISAREADELFGPDPEPFLEVRR